MLSFLIPCCIMLTVFALNGKYPFGPDAALESDAAAQYYPFLLLLRRTVRSGGSLLYTWRAGFGTNFWALIAYYCLNPWNLIAIALPESLVQGFLSLSLCIRIGLAGLFTAVLMQTISKKQDLSIVIFASLYGLSEWFVWNYFQMIWLDAAALLPLLLAGMLRLVRDGRCKMFITVLVISLICNPYFSFITCTMTFLCWICALIILKMPLRNLHREAGRFFGSALLAGGLSAVILIPVAFAIRTTGASAQQLPDLLTVPDSFPALLGRLVSMTYPIQHIGLPNLSCTMLGVLLFTGYLTAKRIPLRERLTVGALLGFLLVSLWYPPLNYIWHGLHVPNGFIHRFAFLVPFVLLMAGWRFTGTLSEADPLPKKPRMVQLGVMLAVTLGICGLAAFYDTTDIVLVSVVFAAGYSLLYLWRYLKPQNSGLIAGVLLLTVCAESFVSVHMLVQYLPVIYQASDLTATPEQNKAAAAIREAEGDSPARTAFMTGYGFNPELFCDLPYGGTLYSSMILGDFADALSYLGIYSGADLNRYFYHPLPPLSMLLTDIRYVIAPNGADVPSAYYQPLGDTCALQFTYDTPFGFCIPAPLDTAQKGSLPERQNHLFRQITGFDSDICAELSPEIKFPGTDFTADGNTIYFRTGAEKANAVTYTFTADADGWYLFDLLPDDALCSAVRQYSVTCDGKETESKLLLKGETFERLNIMRAVGDCKAGQKIQIQMTFGAEAEGSLQICAARLDEAAFAEAYALITANAATDVQVQDRSIRLNITATDDRPLLWLPVPYEKGWRAEIDGQKAEITEAMSGMLGLRLTAGAHTVRLTYLPQGFPAGCAVSTVSILLCVMLGLRKSGKIRTKEN